MEYEGNENRKWEKMQIESEQCQPRRLQSLMVKPAWVLPKTLLCEPLGFL